MFKKAANLSIQTLMIFMEKFSENCIAGYWDASYFTNTIKMREKYFPKIEKFSQLDEEANLTKFQWEIIEKKRREILPPNWKVPNDPLLDFERHFDRVAVNMNEKLKLTSILHIYRRATTA